MLSKKRNNYVIVTFFFIHHLHLLTIFTSNKCLSTMLKRLFFLLSCSLRIILISPKMKTIIPYGLRVLLIGIVTVSTFSCTKIEYDLDHIEGKWIVTSTKGKMILGLASLFEVNDTVRFMNGNKSPLLFVSRPGEIIRYDEIMNLHYTEKHSYRIHEDRLSCDIWDDQILELQEARKERIVFRLSNNGATAILKKEE